MKKSALRRWSLLHSFMAGRVGQEERLVPKVVVRRYEDAGAMQEQAVVEAPWLAQLAVLELAT